MSFRFGTIATAIKGKVNAYVEQKKVEAKEKKEEVDALHTARHAAAIASAPRIAQIETEMKIKNIRQGKAVAGTKGVFEQLTGESFFMKPGQKKADTNIREPRGSRKAHRREERREERDTQPASMFSQADIDIFSPPKRRK